MSSRFERVDAKTIYNGKFFDVRVDRIRYEDGEEVNREFVGHPGAVGIIAIDSDQNLWFVRQPREAVDIPDLLEIPAGKLDVEGENPLEAAKRELAEEIGKESGSWESLGSFYTSPGFTNEEIHIFLATDVTDLENRPEAEENERIDVEVRPLAELDAILTQTMDSKTLVALYRLRDRFQNR